MIEKAASVGLVLSLALVVYHYLGYPAIVIGAARLFGDRRPPEYTNKPRVSLVIAAYNEEAVIAGKIRNSLDLDYPELEILVAADGSDDRTVERTASFHGSGIIVLHEPIRRGKSHALNRAVLAASGEIIVFSDANAMYARNAISELVRGFSHPSVGAVSGCKLVCARSGADADDSGFGRSEGLYWRYENAIRLAESRLGSTVASVGEIFAVRRDAFGPIPAGVVNDDAFQTLDLLRRGRDIRYAPTARSEEFASLSTTDERLRRRRISAGRWQLLSDFRLWPWKRPWVLIGLLSHKGLRLAMPLAMTVILLASAILAARGAGGPWIGLLLVAQLAFYGVSFVGRNHAAGGGALGRLCRMCHFIVTSNISVALGFLDWIRNQQSALWAKAAR